MTQRQNVFPPNHQKHGQRAGHARKRVMRWEGSRYQHLPVPAWRCLHTSNAALAQKYFAHGRVAGGDSAVIRFPRGFRSIFFHGVQFDRHMRKLP